MPNMIDFTLDEHVAVLTMNSGENRLNLNFVRAFMEVLDRIEKETAAGVLAVKSADVKIWSNGIDLDWLLPAVKNEGPQVGRTFFTELMAFLQRLVTYPMITIAAINGHAFAGGALLACAFDFRFMRSDRGFFCLPEIDLKFPFLPGMDAILKKAMPTKYLELQFSGARLTAQECERLQIVAKACHLDDLMTEVLAFAKKMNKDRKTLGTMKRISFAEISSIIAEKDPGEIEKLVASL